MTPQETPKSPRARRQKPSRLKAAWMALRGYPVVHDQFRAEWEEHLLDLSTVYDKLYATIARLYQRDKKILEAKMDDHEGLEAGTSTANQTLATGEAAASGWNPAKIELYRKLRARRGEAVGALNGHWETSDVDGAEAGTN